MPALNTPNNQFILESSRFTTEQGTEAESLAEIRRKISQ